MSLYFQILHCGSYQHWIVASNINCPKDTVYVGLFNSFDQDLMRDHLLKSLENDHFTPFPSCVCSSSLCLSSVERILEVELYCDCRMPELKTSYFGFPTGDMIEFYTL